MDLIQDIRDGDVSAGNLDLPPGLRDLLRKKCLKPDPKRADELYVKFATGFEDIVKKVWPNLNVILATTSGSQEIYSGILGEK